MALVRFPPVELADQDGLLALGGNLEVNTLKEAYSKGISQVALKYLDISDMGFSKKHIR